MPKFQATEFPTKRGDALASFIDGRRSRAASKCNSLLECRVCNEGGVGGEEDEEEVAGGGRRRRGGSLCQILCAACRKRRSDRNLCPTRTDG